MSERRSDTLRCDPTDLCQAMSIHTRKITDACRDKDCIEDLRVYLTATSQHYGQCGRSSGAVRRSCLRLH